MLIEKIAPDIAGVQLRDFLEPHESECLFLTGNLVQHFPGTHLYVAQKDGRWLGVGGYYEQPRAIVLYAPDPETARALAETIADRHPETQSLCAPGATAAAACEVLRLKGYAPASDPRCVLMEADALPPVEPFENRVRPLRLGDHPAVVRLLRYIHNRPQDAPITEAELHSVCMNPECLVLEIDGEIAATAQTNGMGFSAFQILGVATLPDRRNRGYARSVCAALMRRMWGRGARRVLLFTAANNHAALACYRALGFRERGEYWVALLTRSTIQGEDGTAVEACGTPW